MINTFRLTALLGVIACANAAAVAQTPVRSKDSTPSSSLYASGRLPQYLPLENVRSGIVRMPDALKRRVTVSLQKAPLQRVLMEIATQAGLGLSYGEDLVRAAPMISVRIDNRSAADALALAVDGTAWTVLVTATGQVAVSEATRPLVGVVAGRVTDRATNQPVEAAQVAIEGMTLRQATSADGRFSIAGVTAGVQRVSVRRIGYDAVIVPAVVTDGETTDISVALGRSAISLSEMVVTATGTERAREVGNSISILDVAAEPAPVANATELLGGRVAGATVLGNSGQAGQGGTIRLRGVNSISQGNSPIIYVDGIRMSNASTPTSVGGHGSVSPLNDIDMSDVDRIEIVKGPAATTLYGTEASGGVIQLFTKRGSGNGAQVSFDASSGFNKMGHVGAESDKTGMFINDCTGTMTLGDGTKFQDASCPSRGTHLRAGPISRLSLGLRGSTTGSDYFLSGNYEREHAVLRIGENRAGGVRGNVTVRAIPKLALTLNSSFVKRDVRWFPDGLSSNAFLLNVSRGSGSFFKGTGCADRTVVCVVQDSLFSIKNTTATNHFITGGSATYTPIEPLSVRVSAGYDYNNGDITDIVPFGHIRVPLGSINQTLWNRTLITFDAAATYKKSIGASIGTTTSIGGQTFDSRLASTDLSASNFSAPGIPTLTSGALRNIADVNQRRVINAGFFGQEQIGWRDKLFVTGGVRIDGNSAFGTGFGLQTYPKVSASYVISDESFWPLSWLETFKLRAALGESGKAPGAFDAVRTWDPVAAENGQSAFAPSQVGNPNLGPERTRETEGGFDASAFDGRLSVTFSHYNARTNGALVPVVRPPSLGFSARQLENIGVLKNSGSELAVTLDVLRRPLAELSIGLGYTTVTSEAGDLGGQTITIDANSASFVQEGLPAPAYIGVKITNPDDFADPIVERGAYLGGTFPTKIIAPSATLKVWNRVTLNGLGEFQRGGHLVNSIGAANAGLFAWQPCFETQAKLRQAAAGNAQAIADVKARDRARCAVVAAQREGTYWVEANDFFKLRNVSVAIDLPSRLIGASHATSLIISGRNLYKSTKYTGTDPESADQGVNTFSRRDYYIFPPPRTFLVTLRTGF